MPPPNASADSWPHDGHGCDGNADAMIDVDNLVTMLPTGQVVGDAPDARPCDRPILRAAASALDSATSGSSDRPACTITFVCSPAPERTCPLPRATRGRTLRENYRIGDRRM